MGAGRDFLIALSLANLWFSKLWHPFLSNLLVYPRKGPMGPHLTALMLNVLLLAAVCWLAMRAVRRSGDARALAAARFAVLLLLLTSLRWPDMEAPLVEWMGRSALVLIPGLVLLLSAAGARRPRIAHATAVLLLMLSPFVAVTFGQALSAIAKSDPKRHADRPTAAPLPPQAHGPRVVWIIFDELDQQLAFEERPASVVLPQFDRLLGESLVASQAFPPSQTTRTALPGLLTGKLVAKADYPGPDELLLHFQGEDGLAEWSKQTTLFSRAREMGINGGIVGWYHPYCRVLASHFTSCFWDEVMDYEYLLPETLAGRMYQQAATLLEESVRIGNVRPLELESATRLQRTHKLRQHRNLMEHAGIALRRADLGLVLVHLSVPHPFGIYDRVRNAESVDGARSYLDNLALADRALGDLRQVLEEGGGWERSVVLVTSDHAWRRSTWVKRRGWNSEDEQWSGRAGYRVPFLLKMPGQSTALAYRQPFNTILTSELLLAILRGEAPDADAAARWLEQRRSFGLSPYTENP